METTLQPLQMAKNTRGTKRAAAAATTGQENAAPAANVGGKRGTSGEVTKPATRFGFRPPTALTLAPTQPTATVPAAQQSKRRKTNEGAAAQEFEQPSSSAPAAAAAASSGVSTPSRLASSSAAGFMSPSSGVSIPPVAVAGPADAIANLWRETMMDDALAGECRAALANKITATKFDYKERIGQLEAQMKSLRKVVTVLTRKQDGFLADAARIETGLQEDIAAARNRARDVMVEKAALQDKAQRALHLVKQLQAQRDTLMSDAKGAASQLSQHAAVMDAAQALQLDTENKLTQVTSDLQVTVQLLDETTSEREQAKQLLVDLQEQLDAAGQQLAVLEEERNDLRAANEEQAASIEAAQTANAQMETQLSATREQYVALMAQWSTLQKSFEKSEENSANLEKSIASLRAELAHAREAHESSRAELAAQALQAADAKTKSVSEMSALRSSLHAEMAALRHQMEESLARNAEESASLQSTIEQLQSSKTSLQESLSRSSAEVTSLRGSLMHATEKQGSTDVELRKAEGELTLVKMQLAQKNEECFVTVSSFANIQKFHEERQTILQQEKESLEKRMLDLAGKVLALESSGKALQSALDTTAQSLDQRSKELESLRAEHDKATAQAKEDREAWEQSEAGLKAALATLTAESSAQVSKLEAQVSDLTAKYSEEHSRATNLSRELTSFKALSGVSSESQMENLVKLSMEAETLRLQVKDKGDLSASLMETKAALAEALKKVAEGDATRRALHNSIQELKGNIRVFTRVRPLLQAGSKTDVNSGEANAISGEDAVSAIDVSTDGKKLRLDMGNGAPRSSFAFDAVFGPSTTQKELFDEVSPFVQSALDGYHICLFSYGQTGAGKTWSMSGGSGEQRGIIPRSVEKVLEQAQALSAGGWTYTLEAAYLEIYNETIRDLLCKDSKESDLDIKRDISGRTNIPGLTRCPVSSINDVTALMAKAARNRSTASTNMNERSSRSHSVFTLYLSATNPHSKQSLAGSLNLCDLAGSERLSKSGASGDRMKETQSINKSLSSLSDVFMALSQKQAHVPFRNSKLTYLLQPCLSGDGKTAMIINLNPSLSSSNESLCTLRFAAQVSQVELGKPKKQTKTTYDDPMDTSASPAISAAAASPRPSLTGSASSSSLMRPTTASSATKKVAASTIPRPSTGTAMRR